MPQDTADIVGTKGAKFTITIDNGSIQSAYLEVPDQPIVALTISGDNQEVTVTSLPAGDSTVRLDIVWAPGDSNATVDVGTVTTGNATTSNPKPILQDGDTPGYVELFGA
jgi:hypothetical protein